jgi:hypothetical protein
MSASNTSVFNLGSLLEKEKLNGTNFMNWYRDLRIILKQEKTEYVLSEPYTEDLTVGSSVADHRAYQKQCNDALNVSSLMLATMSPGLQKQYEHVDVDTTIQELRGMFENQARVEMGCLRTKQGLRGIISQKSCLCVSWQGVARSVLM